MDRGLLGIVVVDAVVRDSGRIFPYTKPCDWVHRSLEAAARTKAVNEQQHNWGKLSGLGIKVVSAEWSGKVGLWGFNVQCFLGHPRCVFFPKMLSRDNWFHTVTLKCQYRFLKSSTGHEQLIWYYLWYWHLSNHGTIFSADVFTVNILFEALVGFLPPFSTSQS